MNGKSYYEILHDEEIWNDDNFLTCLKEAVNKGAHNPSCLYKGGRLIEEVNSSQSIIGNSNLCIYVYYSYLSYNIIVSFLNLFVA